MWEERKMKKALALVMVMVLALGTAAAETPKTEIVVFAAASLTESLTEIKALSSPKPILVRFFNPANVPSST